MVEERKRRTIITENLRREIIWIRSKEATTFTDINCERISWTSREKIIKKVWIGREEEKIQMVAT